MAAGVLNTPSFHGALRTARLSFGGWPARTGQISRFLGPNVAVLGFVTATSIWNASATLSTLQGFPPRMTAHKQLWVKVNAPVDKGIAELITALSAFPKLQTIESCQGTKGRAWVWFAYGEDWKELADFVLGFLGPKLAEEFQDRVQITIRIVEAGTIRAEMDLPSDSIPAVVAFLGKFKSLELAAA